MPGIVCYHIFLQEIIDKHSKQSFPTKKHLNRVAKNIKSLLNDTRNISHNLMPHAIKELGLIPALNQLTNNMSQSNNLSINLHPHFTGDELDESYEIHLYRILQEALSNVVKHANAENVNIYFSKYPKHISLIIEDDGDSFDLDILSGSKYSKNGGIGIINMKERVYFLNGKIEINVQKDIGTEIVIDIPL